MGALKGKLQYMSPEQAWGRPVDARSDLFSLGAVLFEMVTGERLFTGDSEISVLESVRQGRTRSPRQVDPVDPRARWTRSWPGPWRIEPQDRFQSAGEMKQRLEAALAALSPVDRARPTSPSTSSASWSPSPRSGPTRPPPGPPRRRRALLLALRAAGCRRPLAVAAGRPYPPDPEPPVEAVAPLGAVAVARRGGARAARCSTPPSRR